MLEQISQYRVTRFLGEGHMGKVYEARDTILGNLVAIKVIQPEQGQTRELNQRFLNEARAISAIDHTNVVRLHHVLEEDGDYYMVMQFLDGETLRAIISRGDMPINQVLEVACGIASGLAAAHDHGVVHRDLKPGNIMVTTERVTKVLDFGVAHLVDFTSLTDPGTFVGTLSYAAPEQLQSNRQVDGRTDVYALGVLLFEMLTGHVPFEPEDYRALFHMILNVDAPRISTVRHDLPEGLGRIVDRALMKNPDDRYHDMNEMLHDLRVVRKRVDKSAEADTDLDDHLIAPRIFPRWLRRTLIATVASIVIAGGVKIIIDRIIPPAPPTPRIMVARWEIAAADPSLEWVSGALMSGLIRALGAMDGHNVISRQTVSSTVNALEQQAISATVIAYGAAQAVGASYLVSGTLDRAGPWIRVECELTDVSDEGVLVGSWAIESGDSTRLDEVIVELAVNIGDALNATWREDPRDATATLPTTSTTALKYYELALDAEEQNDFADAMENALQAVEYDSTFAEAHFLISQLTRDKDVERKHYTLAMKYRLRTPSITRKLIEAQGLEWEGEIERPIQLYEEILAEDPEQVSARRQLALLYALERKFLDAIFEYDVLHMTSPLDFSFYRDWSMAYLEAGKRDEAIALISDWHARFPDEEAPVLNYIILCQRMGLFPEGAEVCDSLAAINPDIPYACGWLFRGVGRLDDAEEIFRKLVDSPDASIASSRGHAYLAWLSIRSQDYTAGLQYIERAIAHQDGAWYRWIAGQLALGAGETEQAREQAAAILRLNPEIADTTTVPAWGDHRWYYQLQGWIELSEGDYGEALRWLEMVMRFTSRIDDPRFRTYLGQAYMEAGNYEEAIRQLEIVLEESPRYPEALLYLGATHVLAEDYERAVPVLEQLEQVWRQADPDDPLRVELNRLETVVAEHR